MVSKKRKRSKKRKKTLFKKQGAREPAAQEKIRGPVTTYEALMRTRKFVDAVIQPGLDDYPRLRFDEDEPEEAEGGEDE